MNYYYYLALLPLFLILFCFRRYSLTRKLRKNLSPGDSVHFYIEHDRFKGTVNDVQNGLVDITFHEACYRVSLDSVYL